MCLWRTGSDHRMDDDDGGGGGDCRGHPEEKRRPFSSFGPVRLREKEDALPRRIQLLASRNRVCDMGEQTPISEPCCCKRCLLCSPSCCHLSLCLYHCSVPVENHLNLFTQTRSWRATIELDCPADSTKLGASCAVCIYGINRRTCSSRKLDGPQRVRP